MIELIAKIMLYVARAVAQALHLDEESAAKGLIYAAFDTGVAPKLLSDFLTERGERFAEMSADLAEEAKLTIQEVEQGIEKDRQRLEDAPPLDREDPYK